jgi:phage replication-related protein YjqB (UPF0714/DUF867 family)
MADKYPNFDVLSRNETSGIDFGILVRLARKAFAIVAPHGGGIEPGTSEIADAIAAEEFSFYAFEGLKLSGNADLHITSTRFDEPMCLTLIGHSEVVLTIHGEESDGDAAPVFTGGRDCELSHCLSMALRAEGFDVRQHPDPQLQGLEPDNVCNRGTTGRGVQLELSRSLRRQMFSSLSRKGRKCTTPRFGVFVNAIRGVLEGASSHALPSARGSGR